MNLQSEIEFFTDLPLIDKARLLNLFLHQLAAEARGAQGEAADALTDGPRLRFSNELMHRVTRIIDQLLAGDAMRPADEVVLRMLLSPRTDTDVERMVLDAYQRAVRGFESFGTTVLMK